jgi:glycosyltransferase involved in cell wall biosynthesis
MIEIKYRISVSSFGYFGHFLAIQCARMGVLGCEYTNLPIKYFKKVPKNKISNHFIPITFFITKKIIKIKLLDKILNWQSIEQYDKWVSKTIGECNLFHVFSSFGLHSIKSVKRKYKAITIVERGSSHIQYQNNILEEEYDLLGIKYNPIDNRIIQKELEEYNEADYITVQSTFAYNTFIEKGINKNKLLLHPLGVDINTFKKGIKRDDKFRILYSGNISVRKGLIYLLEAIKIYNNKDMEVVINGHVENDMAHLIKKYQNYVNFTSTRPLNQLNDLYSQASVFVLPTIEDGYAKVISESMACGVPVIATTNCGSQDIINDAVDGFIIPIRSAEAIVEKIDYLYKNKEFLSQMSESAYRKSQLNLTSDEYGKKVISKYLNLIEMK